MLKGNIEPKLPYPSPLVSQNGHAFCTASTGWRVGSPFQFVIVCLIESEFPNDS